MTPIHFDHFQMVSNQWKPIRNDVKSKNDLAHYVIYITDFETPAKSFSLCNKSFCVDIKKNIYQGGNMWLPFS